MSTLTNEDKEILKSLRLLKESSSCVLICLFDESLQAQMSFSDSYYISNDSDMEESLLSAKYFKTVDEAYEFKSGLNIKAVPLSLMVDFEIEKLKQKK